MKLVLATNNKHKIREIKSLLEGMNIRVLTKNDFSIFPEIEETEDTLEANARLKALGIFEFTGLPSLADDSGIEVDYLDGAPGVYSARYAGDECTFEDNNRKLLTQLAGVPRERRTARFRCIIAIAFRSTDVRTVEGRIEGLITTEPRGREGFGYDPIFELPELGRTFAELSDAEKNKISHRGLALVEAKKLLTKYLATHPG